MATDRDDLIAALHKAAEAKQPLEIIYHGGSQPGTRRRILPVRIGDTSMRATDLLYHEAKTFKLDRIELPATGSQAPAYELVDELELERLRETPLSQLSEPYRGHLEALGWHVEISDQRVELYGRFKNGKPRRSPTVLLLYLPERKHRKWYVNGPGLSSGQTFSHPGRALDLVVDQAQKHRPPSPDTPTY